MGKCCNPYKFSHSRTQQRSCKPIADIDRCRAIFPNFPWSEEQELCPRCRLKILKDFKLLEIVRTGVNLAQRSIQASRVSRPGTSNDGPVEQAQTHRESEDVPEAIPVVAPNAEESGDEAPCTSAQAIERARPTDKPEIQSRLNSATSSSSSPRTAGSVASFSDSSAVKASKELNKSLQEVVISPARPHQMKRPHLIRKKYDKLKKSASEAIRKVTSVDVSPKTSKKRECTFCNTLLSELSAKFKKQETRADKYKVLTCIPKRFSIQDVITNTGCTAYQARLSSTLKTQDGAFTYPVLHLGRPMEAVHADIIRRFYCLDDSSRASPNSRDVVRVKQPNGEVVPLERRRILHNLNDLYLEFKKKHPEIPVSLSKFSKLRPKNCVWPGLKGHHITCVCEIHQNFEFLLDAIGQQLKVREFVKNAVCDSSEDLTRPECYLGLCPDCPKTHYVNGLLEDALSDDRITYRQWAHTDSTEIQEVTENAKNFKNLFLDSVPKIIEHEFVNAKQSSFIRNLRETTIKETASICVQVDFAQNYSFIVQNAVQGFHWSNKQATVHPFVVHWWSAEEDEVKFKTYCVISDDTNHDSDTFHVFRAAVIPLILEDLASLQIKKIYYVSDGAASQYKNYRNFCNLVFHVDDFGVEAEWHFTATSHGKSTCDAISAIVKCCTRRQSLKPGQYITTPIQMFNYCAQHLTSERLVFKFVSKVEISEQKPLLAHRYKPYKTVKGTRRHHAFIPKSNRIISIGRTSDSEMFCEVDFKNTEVTEYNDSNTDIGSFYSFAEGGNYQVGLLVEVSSEEGDAKFQILKLNRRSRIANWPDPLNFVDIPFRDILLKIEDPTTENGLEYCIPNENMTLIRQRYNAYKAKLTGGT